MSKNSPSTRQRKSLRLQNMPPLTNGEDIQSTATNLPPDRKSASMSTVSAPLSSTRLSRLIYLLAGLTTLLLAFYSYRVVQYKTEVGGWWSLAMGRTPAQAHARAEGAYMHTNTAEGEKGANTIEEHINALANALGMPSNELASAIASAVREHVPPASLSSVAAQETGGTVDVLLNRVEDREQDRQTQADASPGVVADILRGVEYFAGMDEPSD